MNLAEGKPDKALMTVYIAIFFNVAVCAVPFSIICGALRNIMISRTTKDVIAAGYIS